MEWIALGLFCAALLICIVLDLSILYALAFGLLVFLLYGRRKGFSRRELFSMAFEGIKTVRNILITFVLIGVMTAFWRTAGTIPVIRASRTMDGVVMRDDYDTRVGTVPGYALDPLKARILLSFALTKTRDHGAIEDIFKKYSGL